MRRWRSLVSNKTAKELLQRANVKPIELSDLVIKIKHMAEELGLDSDEAVAKVKVVLSQEQWDKLMVGKTPVQRDEVSADEVQKQAEDHNQAAFFSTQQQLLFRGPRGIGKGQHRQGPAPRKKIGKGQPWRRGPNKTAGDQPPFQHDKGAVDSDAVRQTTPAKDRRQTTPHNKKVGGPRGGAPKKE